MTNRERYFRRIYTFGLIGGWALFVGWVSVPLFQNGKVSVQLAENNPQPAASLQQVFAQSPTEPKIEFIKEELIALTDLPEPTQLGHAQEKKLETVAAVEDSLLDSLLLAAETIRAINQLDVIFKNNPVQTTDLFNELTWVRQIGLQPFVLWNFEQENGNLWKIQRRIDQVQWKKVIQELETDLK